MDQPLTAREQQILAIIIAGDSSKVIARTLGISPRTVEPHRANIKTKLDARGLADLVRIALLHEPPIEEVKKQRATA